MPQALSIGVDYNLFWTLNPKKLLPFVKAKEMNIQYESDKMNYEAWLNGMYVRVAVASIFSKNGKYPDPPSVNSKDEGLEISKKEEVFKSQFEVWAKMHNKDIKKSDKE